MILNDNNLLIVYRNFFRNDRKTRNANGFLIRVYTRNDIDVRSVFDDSINFSDLNPKIYTLQIKVPFTCPIYVT